MKPRPEDFVQLANVVAIGAGREALAHLVDEKGTVAEDIWRYLVKRGAAQ